MNPYAPHSPNPFIHGSDGERQPINFPINRMAAQQRNIATFVLDRNPANQQPNHNHVNAEVHRMAPQQLQIGRFLLDRTGARPQHNQNPPLFPALPNRLPNEKTPNNGPNDVQAERSIGRCSSASVAHFNPVQNPNSPHYASPAGATGIYMPLQSADSFRLLQILPGNEEPLICSLRACRLGENEGAYEALSYTWDKDGLLQEPSEILVNDSKLVIGRNLYDALQRLRLGNKARTVWADAICINQSNNFEKSQQVRMMGNIFAKAWRVVVWLGLNEDAYLYRQTDLESFSKAISSAFTGVCSIVNWWLAQNGHHNRKADYTCPMSGQVSVGTSGGGSGLSRALLNEVFPLFNRGWFARTWVIQEAALAQSVQVLWGGYEISWDWVGLAAAIIKDNLSDSSISRMQSSVSDYQSIPVGVVNAYFMYRISASQTFLKPLEFSFLQLLQLTRKFGCKSGHDRIYALLGLPTTDYTSENIVPDYEQSIGNVYEDLARLILQSDMSLAILSSVGHSLVLPSWVPTWHLSAPDSLRPMVPHAEFQCGTSMPRQIRLPDGRSTLETRGVIVDEIASIFSEETSLLCWTYSPSTKTYQQPHMSQGGTGDTMFSTEAFRVISMTLTGGLDWRGYPVDTEPNLANFAAAFLAQELNWRALDAVFSLANIPHAFNAQNLTDLEELAQGGESAPYVNAVRATFFSHVIFATKSGMIGVGPSNNMRVGDHLATLLGANVPFLLRPVENAYRVVGECYVYSIMHGEVIGRLSDAEPNGRLNETWLTLI